MRVQSENRSNEEKMDVEAAVAKPVTGIVLGMDSKDDPDDNALVVDQAAPAVQRKKHDYCILFMTLFYSLLVVAFFVWPRINANRSGVHGFEEIAQTLAIVFVVGGSALVVASVNLLTTVTRWPRLTTASKIAGVFPVLCSIVITMVIVVLVKIYSSNDEENIQPCPSMNATGFNHSSEYDPCHFPKNENGTSF